jgi:hypothetical protein
VRKEQSHALASLLYVLSAQLADMAALVMTLADSDGVGSPPTQDCLTTAGQDRANGGGAECDQEAQVEAIRRALWSYGHASWAGLRRAANAALGHAECRASSRDLGALRRVCSQTGLDARAILEMLDRKAWGRSVVRKRRARTNLRARRSTKARPSAKKPEALQSSESE